eukprot:12890946-Prorocentrum_lima.AAC.1
MVCGMVWRGVVSALATSTLSYPSDLILWRQRSLASGRAMVLVRVSRSSWWPWAPECCDNERFPAQAAGTRSRT